MKLTIRVERVSESLLRGSFEELPAVFYESEDEAKLVERLERLAKALSSPHIHISKIMPDGDVVLVLERKEGLAIAPDPSSTFLTLSGAIRALRTRSAAVAVA